MQDNQVPHFRKVFLTLHVMFIYITGIHLLNSASSLEHSHQTFVLKEHSFGADCSEKAQ